MKSLSILLGVMLLTMIFAAVPGQVTAQSYSLMMYTDKQSYLDSDWIHVTYVAYGEDGKVLAGGGGKWFLNSSLNDTVISTGNITGSHGEINIPLFKLNLTAAGSGTEYTITMIYKYENSTKKAMENVWIIDSNFLMFQVQAYPETAGFHPGTVVTVEISSPVPDERIKYLTITHNMATWKNITGLYIGHAGYTTYNFQIPGTWKYGDTVNIIAKIGNSTANTAFSIGIDHSLYLKIKAPHKTVLSGDTINVTVTYHNITSPYFHFYIIFGNTILYRFYTSNNHISYRIPKSFSGYLDVNCVVFNSTQKIGTIDTLINVKYGILNINFDHHYYSGGETVKAYTDFISNTIKNTSFIYALYAYDGHSYELIAREISTAHIFSFNVPNSPPQEYLLTVTAYNNIHTLSSSAKIMYRSNLYLEANILTQSSYSTSAYTPGEQIEIHYSIHGLGGPGFLYYGFGDSYYTHPKIVRIKGDGSGDFTIVIPENTMKGIYDIHMEISGPNGSRELSVPIFVDNNPPWSQYLIFTMPAADFITIVLVSAGLISAVIYIKYDKKNGEKKSESGEKPL